MINADTPAPLVGGALHIRRPAPHKPATRTGLHGARLLLLLTASLGAAACGTAETDAGEPIPRAVGAVAPSLAPAQPPIEAVGRLQLRAEQQLSFRVPGIVGALSVRAGDTVTAGQRLAALVDTEVEARVTQARARLDKAERDLARGRRLYADEVIPRQQLDDLTTAAELARAELERARFNRRHAVITAPADGLVLQRMVEENENVAAGQPVIALGQTGSGFVLEVALPERDLLRLHRGASAQVRLDAVPGRVMPGRVTEISGQADARTATFSVDIAVEPTGADLRLASGMLGRARIDAGSDAQPISAVPLSALVNSGTGTQIFVVEADQAHALPVTVRWFDDKRAALTEALPPETRVVDRGAGFLRHGESVRVLD